jgi:outer membrane protein TolC
MLVFCGASLPAEEPDWSVRLSETIARAIAENPSIAQMEAEVKASQHRAAQARALPDPELEIGIVNVPTSDFSLSRDFMTMEQVGVRQRFPAAGARPARKRFAEAIVASVASTHEDHVVRLAAEVADAFFAVAGLDGRIAALEQSRERLGRVAASALERYRVGRGAQTDVLRADVETAAVEERLAGLRGERQAMAARLRTLQNLPPLRTSRP